MKRILLILLATLWLVPGAAMAHSKMDSSSPAADATTSVSPAQIEMSFNTSIEKLSNFKLLNEAGEQVPTGDAVVNDTSMSGEVTEPLPNGSYTVKWTIIGADGHSVEGQYSFKVEAAEAAVTEPPAASPEQSTEPVATETPEPEASAQPETSPSPTEDEQDGGLSTAGLVIVGIVLVAAIVLIIRRRQK